MDKNNFKEFLFHSFNYYRGCIIIPFFLAAEFICRLEYCFDYSFRIKILILYYCFLQTLNLKFFTPIILPFTNSIAEQNKYAIGRKIKKKAGIIYFLTGVENEFPNFK